MKKVIVTSLNPAKISAVKSAFDAVFPNQAHQFIGVKTDSGVPDQPMNDEETYSGAQNRVNNARISHPDADFYVGIEAGIDGQFTFAWMIIESENQRGQSRSACLMLPPEVTNKVSINRELGDVMDEVFGTENIKQKGGAISLLTHDLLTRSSVYHQALVLALIPFANSELFPETMQTNWKV